MDRAVSIFIVCLIWLILSFLPAYSNYEFLGKVERMERIPSGLVLTCEGNNLLKIRFLTSNMFRVTLGREGKFEPPLEYPLAKTGWETVPLQFDQDGGQIWLSSREIVLTITRNPCRLTVSDTSGFVFVQDDPAFGIGWDGKEVRCWKCIAPDEKFYGLGEKTGNLNKRGVQWEMWNSDIPGYSTNYDPLYQSIPFFIGMRNHRAYGIYFNNSYRTVFNMGAGNLRYYSFSAEQGSMDYFVIFGPQVRRVVETYTLLTGRPPMWPRWALGYQQCRWSYFPQDEVLDLAKTFRRKRIPADVLYLDIHYMDGYRVFTWDRNRFPDPEDMLKQLREMGFRVVVIIDPGVKADSAYAVCRQGLEGDHFLKYPDGTLYRGEVWPGVAYFPDFSRAATRQWWSGLLGRFLQMGISGTWNDMNEPAVWGKAFPREVIFNDGGLFSDQKKMHNLYGFLMAQTAYEGNLQAYPNQRPFVITRAGFAGEQRFTTVWTGDNVASWDHLNLGIRMLQGLGLSGISFVGMDVGGFIGHPTPELFARWLQVGAFVPLFRTHTHYGSEDQEPWSFGEDMENLNRETIRWRYRLIPYLYSLLWESHRTGAPVIRPLLWHYQNDENAYGWDVQNQFMVGGNLLIAPVTEEGQYLRKLYLLRGKWLEWQSGKVYEGGRFIIAEAPMWKIPVFLRAGGILPLWEEEVQWSGEKPMEQLTLYLFPADSGHFDFYEDDGESLDYLNGKYRLSRFYLKPEGRKIHLRQKTMHRGYSSALQRFKLVFLNLSRAPQKIILDGKMYRMAHLPDKLHFKYSANEQKGELLIWKRDFKHLVLE